MMDPNVSIRSIDFQLVANRAGLDNKHDHDGDAPHHEGPRPLVVFHSLSVDRLISPHLMLKIN